MSKRLVGVNRIIGCKDKTSARHVKGSPDGGTVVTLGQQYNIGEKPTVILSVHLLTLSIAMQGHQTKQKQNRNNVRIM